MVRLYRSANDLQHWFVRLPSVGWMRFPVKRDGWAERRTVDALNYQPLAAVPLWLAFHTGLLESIKNGRLDLAA